MIRFYNGINQEDYDRLKELIKKEFGAKYLTIHFVEWREEE